MQRSTIVEMNLSCSHHPSRRNGMGRVYDVNRTTKETSVRVCIDLDGTGRHEVAHGHRLFRPHARPAGGPRPVRPDREGRGRHRTWTSTTPWRTWASRWGRRWPVPWATARDPPLRRRPGPHGRGAGPGGARSAPGAPTSPTRTGCPRQGRRDGHRALPGVFRGVRAQRGRSRCTCGARGPKRPPRRRGGFKAFGPRAAAGRRDRSAPRPA